MVFGLFSFMDREYDSNDFVASARALQIDYFMVGEIVSRF